MKHHLTAQQAEEYYNRILHTCSSENSLKGKGNDLRTIFDDLLNTVCYNSNIVGESSLFAERIKSLYPIDSPEYKILDGLRKSFNRVQHNSQIKFSETNYISCVTNISQYIAQLSGTSYPAPLTVFLKNNKKVPILLPQPIILLRELYTNLDQLNHAEAFISTLHNELKHKNKHGYKEVKFDVITYANPIFYTSYSSIRSKKNRSDGLSVPTLGEDGYQIIVNSSIESAINAIKDGYYEFSMIDSLCPFLIWMFYDIPFNENNEIIVKLNETISEYNVSFYPIILSSEESDKESQKKHLDQLSQKVSELFPKSKTPQISKYLTLPENLIKSIMSAIVVTNQRFKMHSAKEN